MRPFALFATIAAAIFVGGSGTLLVQHVLAPTESPRPVAESTGNTAVDPELVGALIQLSKELRESRSVASPLAAPSAETFSRSVATESGQSALAELAAAVRELRGALQHGSAGTSATSLPALTLPRDDLRAWLPELPAEVTDPDRAYTRQHLFWSEQQVLERYGAPDQVRILDNGCAYWSYEDPEEGGNRSFHVRIFQGRVIGITPR